MKLSELCKEAYLLNGNVPCIVNIETAEIRKEFGHTYKGYFIECGGLNGRIGDVPAYWGDCEVKDYQFDWDKKSYSIII